MTGVQTCALPISEGEYQAATKLTQAADIMSGNDQALQLRYLQTLREIATENNSTTIFPLPMDLLKAFKGFLGKGKDEGDE